MYSIHNQVSHSNTASSSYSVSSKIAPTVAFTLGVALMSPINVSSSGVLPYEQADIVATKISTSNSSTALNAFQEISRPFSLAVGSYSHDVVTQFLDRLMDGMRPMEAEYSEVIEDSFWDILWT